METVGRKIREARINKGLSVEDVAQVSKIPRATIAHIEAGRVEHLPAPVFTRGFIRTLATIVGLDGVKLLRSVEMEPTANLDESHMVRAHSGATLGNDRNKDPFAHLLPAMDDTTRGGFHPSHGVLLLVVVAMFLTAWLTVGMSSDSQPGNATGTPAIQEAVDGVSSYTSADALRD